MTIYLTHNTNLSVSQPNNALMPLKTVARIKTTTKKIPRHHAKPCSTNGRVKSNPQGPQESTCLSRTLASPQKMVYFDKKDIALQLFQLSAHVMGIVYQTYQIEDIV